MTISEALHTLLAYLYDNKASEEVLAAYECLRKWVTAQIARNLRIEMALHGIEIDTNDHVSTR